jgi:hypothetical protein
LRLKTKIWIVLFLFVVTNYSIAQSYYRFGFEIIGGTNFSYYSEDSPHIYLPTPHDGKFGYNVGVGFTYRFTKIFASRIEIIYLQKIFQQSDYQPLLEYSIYLRQKLNYIEIDLLIQLNFSSNSLLQPSSYLGSYLSLLTNQKQEYNFPTRVFFDASNTDFGFLIGGSLGFQINSYEVCFELRYHYDLGDIGNYYSIYGWYNIKNTYKWNNKLNSLMILLKFGFNFIQIID